MTTSSIDLDDASGVGPPRSLRMAEGGERQPAGLVQAEETGAGRFQTAVRAGGAEFVADEPMSVGGLGSGPTPFDLLSAALAACTTMTLRLYIDQKSWPVTRVRATVRYERIVGQRPQDVFTRLIDFEGMIDPAQRARLLQIAERCPVHLLLAAAARIETRVR